MNMWLTKAIEIALADNKAVLITVAEAKGSSPREAGAKMLVTDDAIFDTIGGGALEHDAINVARQMLADNGKLNTLKDYPLGPSLEQCCGGFMRLVFEPITKTSQVWLNQWQEAQEGKSTTYFKTIIGTDQLKVITSHDSKINDKSCLVEGDQLVMIDRVEDNSQSLWIFGGGHVAEAIVNTLKPLNFSITIVDQREGFVNIHGVKTIQNPAPFREVEQMPAGSMALIMTHSHAQDYDICTKAISRGDLSFVGLIGSNTKKARFIKRMRDKGLTESTISKLTCPIGIGNTRDKRPAAIAISVAAQLLDHTKVQEQQDIQTNLNTQTK